MSLASRPGPVSPAAPLNIEYIGVNIRTVLTSSCSGVLFNIIGLCMVKTHTLGSSSDEHHNYLCDHRAVSLNSISLTPHTRDLRSKCDEHVHTVGLSGRGDSPHAGVCHTRSNGPLLALTRSFRHDMPSRSPHPLTPPRIPTFNTGRHICKFYVDTARQPSADDGSYGVGCCELLNPALFTSKRPPGDVSSPFPTHICAFAGCWLVPTGVPYRTFSTCKCGTLWDQGVVCCLDTPYCPWER